MPGRFTRLHVTTVWTGPSVARFTRVFLTSVWAGVSKARFTQLWLTVIWQPADTSGAPARFNHQ